MKHENKSSKELRYLGNVKFFVPRAKPIKMPLIKFDEVISEEEKEYILNNLPTDVGKRVIAEYFSLEQRNRVLIEIIESAGGEEMIAFKSIYEILALIKKNPNSLSRKFHYSLFILKGLDRFFLLIAHKNDGVVSIKVVTKDSFSVTALDCVGRIFIHKREKPA